MYKTDLNAFYASSNRTGLDKWLSSYGLNVESTLIMDEQSQPIQVSSRHGFFMVTNIVKYPPFIIATNLDRESPFLKNIDSLVMPFASPIKISTAPAKIKPIIRTSRYSQAKNPKGLHFIPINPFNQMEFSERDLKGPFTIGISAMGKFGGEKENKLVLLSTSKFIRKNMGLPPSNYAFFFNALDWLSEDMSLITIRTKAVKFMPLKEVKYPVKTLVKYLNILLPPLLTIFIGLIIWRRGERARKNLMLKYAEKNNE